MLPAAGNGRPGRPIVRATAVLAALAFLVGGPGAISAGAQGHAIGTPPAIVVDGAGACPGAVTAANVSGTLGVQGGPTDGPSVSNVSVTLTYDYQVNYTPHFGNTSYSCTTALRTSTTSVDGGFSLNATLPNATCSKTACTRYDGPFAPARLAVQRGAPAGYFVASRLDGIRSSLAYVAVLNAIDLTPSDPGVLSVNAPLNVSVRALAGNGAPSPGNVSFTFGIDGNGWSMVTLAGGASVAVEAVDGASPGTLSVVANGTYHNATLSGLSTSLLLVAVATTIAVASVAPTELDEGTASNLNVTGSGAPGYSYAANVTPGLGEPSFSRPCASHADASGVSTIDCAIPLVYHAAGTAQPVVNLSNGRSTSTWTLPTLNISHALSLVLGPRSLVGYSNAPIPVGVDVMNGTGTAPFGPACLYTPTIGEECLSNGGPNWSFPLTYTSPGRYNLTIRVTDSADATASLNESVRVVPLLDLGAVTALPGEVPIGTNATIASSFSGGAGPWTYWWNVSATGATVAWGSTDEAGRLSYVDPVNSTGPESLTLTVRDALGSAVTGAVLLDGILGPARAIALSCPSATSSLIAGEPLAVSLHALAPGGTGDPEFDANLSISTSGPGASAPGWVNASGVGTLPSGPNGSYTVPGSAWSNGYLNVTLDPTRTGLFHAEFASEGLPLLGVFGANLSVEIISDPYHLRLGAPVETEVVSGVNETLYPIADRFGNAAPAGFVEVRFASASTEENSTSWIEVDGAQSFVWVNYSKLSGAGTLYVVSGWGEPLLGPVAVDPPAPSTAPPYLLLLAGAALVALASLAASLGLRRRSAKRFEPRSPGDPEVGEAELHRLAIGRAHILGRLSDGEAHDAEALRASWRGEDPPSTEEMAEWLGTLTAEGTVQVEASEEGSDPRYRRATPSESSEEYVAKVRFDRDAFDSMLERQGELRGDSVEGPGAVGHG